MGPLAIGLSLAMIHFASMGATGTSVNPARSIGVAVFGGTDAILQLWLFIVAPLVGAIIAGLTYPLVFGHGSEPVPGSGVSFGGGRRQQGQYAPPSGYEQQWNQGQQGTYAAPSGYEQQWNQGQQVPPAHPGQPGQVPPPQQWGPPAPQQPPPGQWGQPAPQQPQPGVPPQGQPQQWGQPLPDDGEDGRTQVRRPD